MGLTAKISTRADYELKISREELLALIANQDVPEPIRIPDFANVTVHVPGGGDYSNMTLSLEEVGGIVIRWTETKSE